MTHPIEQIEAAVIGALTPTEQAAFDEHVAGCPACAGLLAEARAADAAMNELFAGHRPDDDFEERMIANIRRKQVRITHPLVRRVAVGVAASIVLGGIGYVGSAGINGRGLPGYALLGPQRVGAGNAVLIERRSGHVYDNGRIAAGKNIESGDKANTNVTNSENLVKELLGGLTSSPTPRVSLNTADITAKDSSTPLALTVRPDHQYAFRNPTDRDGTIAEQAAEAGQLKSDNILYFRAMAGAQADIKARPGIGEVEKLSKSQKESNQLYYKISDGKQSWGTVPEAEARFQSGMFPAGVGLDTTLRTYSQGGGGFGGGGGGGGGRNAGDVEKLATDVNGKDLRDSEAGAAHLPSLKAARGTTPASNAANNYTMGPTTVVKTSPGEGDSARKLVEELEQVADPTLATKAGDAKKVSEQLGVLENKVKREEPAVGANAPLAVAPEGKPDAQGQQNQAPPPPPAVDPAHPDVLTKPKIIRTGEMEFEVDSFDSTVGIINKVIAEEQGYISTTNSDKLANGKVKGSVVLRVPAEHLDTLVLKLRGIGDLRSQHINAQDITKQFTDTESALRAAKAMQERLLDIIKNGKGAVKDLLEAEKQLGTWREKVEQLEGEIRYYSNQVSMSTLTLTLFERDIRQPALASETETVTMALETDKVDDAYAKAKDAITQAKGRIVNSELKQFDAGQFGATIVAQVPPDAADAVLGRLKQFDGRVARFERQRNQTTSNGNAPSDGRLAADPVKVKREDVTINLTLYNLANVAPRRTTTLTVVASDVEKSYHALIDQVRSAGGRVITSQINRGKEDQVAGAVNFNVPTEKADVLLAALRGWGEVLKTETAESPDTQNVTESKRGFNVTIGSLSAFPARETQQVQLAAVAVPEAFNDLLSALRTGAARIIASRLNELDRGNANATLEFEIKREAAGAIEQAMAKDGQVITRAVNRSTDTDNTVDSKLHIAITLASSEQLPPRQSTEMSVEVTDVQKAMEDLQAAALTAGGRQVDNPAISQGDNGQTTATLTVDVPLDKVSSLIESADGKGIRKNRRTSIDAHAPEGKLAGARLTVTFATPATLTGNDGGALAGIRSGLGTSLRGLSYSLTMIIVGVCLVAPWALLIGGIWRAVKWAKKNRAPAAAV